jgi:hypothetical protein
VVEIRTHTDGKITLVTVTDNGAGITPATVAGVCDFTVLVSDKARYRGPARGAQGNALKTLLGIPAALGVTEPVVIDSAGTRHELQVTVDAAGEVVVRSDQTTSARSAGTSVRVPLPADLGIDPHRWAYGAALVNPHAAISVIDPAHSGGNNGAVFYKPSAQRWSKWTPSLPSSVHWYDEAAFTALVGSHVREIGRTGGDVPLGRFISEFDGLSGSAKQKAIRTAAPGITHLSGLDGRGDIIAGLHAAMLEHAKRFPPSRLGPVGRDHLQRLLDDEYGVARFWYKHAACTVDGVPWLVEVAVADTLKPGRTWFACNHAPAFGDPLGRTILAADETRTTGAASFLAAADAETGSGGNRAAVVHVICAATQFVDKGKVALVVPPSVANAAVTALTGATKTLQREADQRRKDARRAGRAAQRARDAADRAGRRDRWTVKDAVFAVLPDAKAAAGDVVAARTLFYKTRPRIQDLTDAELRYGYFSQELLPEYERTVAPLPGLYYEARGELHHPHDDIVIRLGTREVVAYIPPSWQFNKILYIEKTGLAAQLAPYRFGQRYDMAIIYGSGYPVTSCRDLLARSDIREMQVLVLHDADPHGYNIARTLAEATRRMPHHSIDVIDLGLTVPQAITLELETEQFTRKAELPAELELDPDALEWFTGQRLPGYRKPHYDCRRCELNAFSSDGLAEFIEAGLQRHGATTKLVPPEDVLAEYVEAARDDVLTKLVAAELGNIVDIDAVVNQLLVSHPGLVDVAESRVRDRFTDAPAESWRLAAKHLVNADIDAADRLTDIARTLLAEQLGGEQ